MRPAMIWSIVADMLGPAALRSGLTPLSHVAGLYLCTEATLALFSRLENEMTACLCFSSGSRIILGRRAHNRGTRRHVAGVGVPAGGVHHELLRKGLGELAGAAQQGAAQVCRSFDFLAVRHRPLRVDGRIRLPIDIPPLPGD